MIVLLLVVLLATASGDVWTNPIIVGLVVGIPTSVFGFKAYRRAEALDAAAARSAMIAAEGDAVQRVIDGLDLMVKNLRTDNAEVRERADDLTDRLQQCRVAYDDLKRLAGGDTP